MAEKPKKDPIAQAMVRKRWDKTTAKKRSEIARELARKRWGPKKTGGSGGAPSKGTT